MVNLKMTRILALLPAILRARANSSRREELRAEYEARTVDQRRTVANLIALEIHGARSQAGKREVQDVRRLEQSRSARLALISRSAPTDW